mmetsp:Transcript_5226/g.14723  ORF Transcript_5226/g.14723 Transcript_5226/m.14723 type:complete len:137 (-) Transcript_5226:206-616(-)|eukprot:CAMPEP_0119121586 /NCGR_PEP_ID=MMETSP1310-20130426/2150_1 /TAXON_ID=464262 /ORGANISM="Genus nov. species nov., Strain RCC2339" /LENGTH=136 /DNA_ID=CAMNT_0007111157 /DNA_START=36 /DNA_END=446 /DNA_ORIENTATION=+
MDRGGDAEALEAELDAVLQNLNELNIVIQSYQNDSEKIFLDKINSYVSQLHRLEDLCATDVSRNTLLPIDTLSILDEGKHPDLHTQKSVQEYAELQSKYRGKATAVKEYRDSLQELLKTEFPELYDEYVKASTEES